jgi:hypothetical protein
MLVHQLLIADEQNGATTAGNDAPARSVIEMLRLKHSPACTLRVGDDRLPERMFGAQFRSGGGVEDNAMR